MEKQIKGAIFDLDGTILDSMGMWRNLDRNFVESFGKVYDPQISRDIVGMTLEQAADHFRKVLELGMTTEQILDQWNDHLLNQYKNVITLKNSVDKVIDKWYSKGIKMCVATLTDNSLASVALEKFGLLSKMEFILTVSQVGKSKRHPDIYLKSAEKMGLLPQECVVLEDTYYAIKAAKEAGFTVYCIDDENAVDRDKSKEICDKYITDFSVLL